MGFFNKFLKGLGFEDEEPSSEPVKIKEKKKKSKPISASFDLNKSEDFVTQKNKPEVNYQFDNLNQNDTIQQQTTQEQKPTNSSMNVVVVNTQMQVQNVVNRIKNGEKLILNFSSMNQQDLVRSLDFLSGAVFALGLVMQRVDSNIYLVQ
ncbi:MAG: cell division protein SepF [Clostridiales bacterium]|nr:cell division protein SepF [Clostridiales bacterium]